MVIIIYGQTTKKITGKGITEETSYGRNGKPKTSNGINLLKEDGDYNENRL